MGMNVQVVMGIVEMCLRCAHVYILYLFLYHSANWIAPINFIV